MTLLDRFRTQPQRDPDPAVRLAYLAELPLTERDQIVAAAREDSDARVRKAAVGKLLDPEALAAIARDDADSSVRDAHHLRLRADRSGQDRDGRVYTITISATDPATGLTGQRTVQVRVPHDRR